VIAGLIYGAAAEAVLRGAWSNGNNLSGKELRSGRGRRGGAGRQRIHCLRKAVPSLASDKCCETEMCSGYGIDAPAVGNALEFMFASRFEVEAASSDEVFDGLRDEHL
jgi:hypothetical protein